MATLLGVAVGAPEFDAMLGAFPCEDWTAWAEDNQKENAYRLAKLSKYKLDMVDTFTKTNFTDVHKEELKGTTEKNNDSKSLTDYSKQLAAGSSSVTVKLEVPEWALLEVELKVLKSADPVISKLMGEMKKQHAQLEARSANADCVALNVFKHSCF